MAVLRLETVCSHLVPTPSPSLFRPSVGLPLRLSFGDNSLPGGCIWEVRMTWDQIGP